MYSIKHKKIIINADILTNTQLTTFKTSSAANATVYDTLLAAVTAYDSAPVTSSSDSSSSDVSSVTSSDVSSKSSDTEVSSEDTDTDTDTDSEDSTDLGTSDEGSSSVTSIPATSSVATETNADTGDTAVPVSVAAALLLSAGAAVILNKKIHK